MLDSNSLERPGCGRPAFCAPRRPARPAATRTGEAAAALAPPPLQLQGLEQITLIHGLSGRDQIRGRDFINERRASHLLLEAKAGSVIIQAD